MSGVVVITNNHFRPWILWDELTEEEKKDNDYASDYPDARFFRYKGSTYSEDEFSFCDREIWRNWDGMLSDTFFSGILISYDPEDSDYIKVGRFYACN